MASIHRVLSQILYLVPVGSYVGLKRILTHCPRNDLIPTHASRTVLQLI
jgi:hypothetical protein